MRTINGYSAGLLLAACIAVAPAGAADTAPRYNAWQGSQNPGQTDTLIRNLKALIDEADRAKAADPRFIQDLREILADYQSGGQNGGQGGGAGDGGRPLVKLFSDDFQDGDFTRNPTWTVSAGAFDLESNRGLHSSIGVAGKQSVGTMLGGLLKQQQGTAAQDATFASIYTPVRISNAFSLQVELASRNTGRVDFGPYAGAAGDTAYRVTYKPGAQGGLQLQRVTPQGTTMIGHWDGAIDTANKRRHVIKMTRDSRGAMQVWLDGQKLIDARDDAIRQPFDGFLLVNSNGEHWVRSIAIEGTQGS